MPSRAKAVYLEARKRANRLTQLATDTRLRPISYEEMEPALHAALAAHVSAWEAYIEDVVNEALDEIGRALNAHGYQVLQVLKLEANRAIDSFNTPNFENTRTLILRYLALDAYTLLQSARMGGGVEQTKSRLNEILKVRHTFAHGKPLPAFSWLTRYGVTSRLSKSSVTEAGNILSDLVTSLDGGISNHINSAFGCATSW